MAKTMMIRVNAQIDASVLNIQAVRQGNDGVYVLMHCGVEYTADCSKTEMNKRIDAAWEGR